MISTARIINEPKTQEQLEKEKAEKDLKKWEKQQKLMTLSNNPSSTNNSVQKSQLFDFSGLSLSKNKYDSILNLGKSKNKDENLNPADYVDIHIWVVCKRIFKSFGHLERHIKSSGMHRENVEEQRQKSRMNEIEMSD